MSAQPEPEAAGVDIWTAGGPWEFSRETVITGPPAESLYRLYRRSFDPLGRRAAARQVLTRGEFFSEMEDHRIDKYIAWENEEGPVGMITVTRHLEAVPWISPEYYAARFPEQWSRRAIYYLGFTLVRPGIRRTGFLETVTRMCIEPLISEKAVLAYDVCGYNRDALGFADLFADTFQQHAHTRPRELDTQVYYAVNFA
ncbi:MAG TPA: hypothetical protein VK401_11370 [Propionibacteriaceae bacterium]|jgi:hypothetical protein|nr:hypothetical protein [Propionibacteriaceae bacterium]